MLGLRERLIQLSTLVAEAILQGTTALITHDTALASQVSTDDVRLYGVRFGIEEMTYAMLETHQLKEREVRLVVSMVIVSQALEQIGDNAANVAHLGLRLIRSGENGTSTTIKDELSEMARTAAEMVNDAVKAFVDGDARLAEATVRRDRELNEAYERLTGEETQTIPAERRLLLQWSAHNLQQIGTYVTAICERAIFVATGEFKEFR